MSKPYVLQLQNTTSPVRWREVDRFTDRVEAVTAGKAYLAVWGDGRIARVVREVVSVEVLWGGIAR